MHLGLLTSVFGDLDADAAFAQTKACGVSTVEIGTGGYPGKRHCDPELLLASTEAFDSFRNLLDSYELTISALACHGNPIHPDPVIAERDRATFERTVELAQRLDVNRVTLFSGCPGDSDASIRPNWVTCAWPTEYLTTLEWQWEVKVVPYWTRAAAYAADHGVDKLCFEMHPGFVVYHPPSLLRLRDAVGPAVGANLDPSHLMWQGIDVLEAIRVLGEAEAIHHVHAKDTAMNPRRVAIAGVLDTVPLGEVAQRSWIFRTVGFGHDVLYWRNVVSALRVQGYDDVLSIEHEDALASTGEGVRRAVALLNDCILTEPAATPWWTD